MDARVYLRMLATQTELAGSKLGLLHSTGCVYVQLHRILYETDRQFGFSLKFERVSLSAYLPQGKVQYVSEQLLRPDKSVLDTQMGGGGSGLSIASRYILDGLGVRSPV